MVNIDLIESLSPIERKIVPLLEGSSFIELIDKSGLDRVSVLRALEFLNTKKIIELKISNKKVVDLGTNGIYYKKKGLPERQLLHLVEKGPSKLEDAQKHSKLSTNEFKAALGALKKKMIIEIKNATILFSGNKEEVTKKSLEEQFLELLPIEYDSLKPEQLFALKSLQERKDIVEIVEEQVVSFTLTKIGKEIIKEDLSNLNDSIEELSPEMLLKESWRGKKFRRYDVESNVPLITGGKKHFVNQSIEYSRKIWGEMGFEEMSGDLLVSSFWNFDSLFTAQDHPVREMQDTFFLNHSVGLPDKKLVNAVKQAHEIGVDKSKGWNYSWNEEEAKKLVLRTHTTCLSSQTLSKLNTKDLPKKFFAIGKCFRNETLDWSHGFEFNQTEGIVVDKDANFRHLLGYLHEFFKKMGFPKVRFQPAYFPYTEPSVEIYALHPVKKVWIELGGAGILRPEVVIPLLGEYIPVLAWGPGFDRIIMDYYKIQDLREMYKNDIDMLRKIKLWNK